MVNRNQIGVWVLFFLLFSSLAFGQETLTITTYYPSPYGDYNQLTTHRDTYLATDSGNVGIGTTRPGAKLDVRGQVIGGFGAQAVGGTTNWNDISNVRSGSGYTLLRGNAANGPGPATYFHPFNFEYSSKNGNGNVTQLAIPYSATSHMNSGMYMRGRYSATWSPWMKIISENSNGRVGIGTVSPNSSSRLDVAGEIHSSDTSTGFFLGGGGWSDNWCRLTTNAVGTYHDLAIDNLWAAGAQRYDLAEVTPVKKEDKLEQGDTVVIDRENGLRATRSKTPYDTSVYGIVSSYDQAAMVIGGIGGPEVATNTNEHLPIALIGRVKAKVSAENGAIEVGNLLTTSATPGHLMKCDEVSKCAGAIAGKALESLKEGKGTITILVTLQ